MHLVASQRRASYISSSDSIKFPRYARRARLGMPVQRTISQFMTEMHGNNTSDRSIMSNKKQKGFVRGSPARHMTDAHRWYRVMSRAQSNFRRTHAISTTGIVSKSSLQWNLIGTRDGKFKIECAEVSSESLPRRKIFSLFYTISLADPSTTITLIYYTLL